MKQNNVVSFIITYAVIFLVVVFGGYKLYSPIHAAIKNNNMQTITQKVESLSVSDEIKQVYNEYNNEVKTINDTINKSLSNIVLLTLMTLSLTLIIFGIVLIYNSRKNRGIHIALVASGFTIILFAIWFIFQRI